MLIEDEHGICSLDQHFNEKISLCSCLFELEKSSRLRMGGASMRSVYIY